MKGLSILAGVLLAAIIGAGSVASAQTPPTRSTPCNPATPWDAVCLGWSAVTEYEGGGGPLPAGTVVTYRVEQASAASGPWVDSATAAITGTRAYVTGLAPGTYYFRVFAAIPTGASGASNVASRGVNNGKPAAPVITIAVVISPDNAPVMVNLAAFADRSVTCEVRPS